VNDTMGGPAGRTGMTDEIAGTIRETGVAPTPVGEGRTVRLRRTYHAPIDDVWDALTTAARINRWFLPISGELRLGGRYQFEGNAGGEILACEPPNLLRVSWVMGEVTPETFSEVEVRLTPCDEGTSFELTHTATVPPGMWDQFGPGAVGVGWDGALLGLARYLASGAAMSTEDKAAWLVSEEAKSFYTAAARAWGDAHRAAGVSAEVADAAVAATTAFYAPAGE
jgi:uncharacterized protein YndB with AHSA1/START domain